MRRITIGIVALAMSLAACTDSNSVGPTAAVAGMYSLRAINGTNLPVTFSDGSRLMSDVLTLNIDGSYSDVAQFDDGSVSAQQGFYTNNNGSIELTDSNTHQTVTASLSGTILTEFVGGLTEVFQRT
ncbi:MAG TPA: hypothetical protein VF785_00235 [Gemmatimonadaceae bacterium]